MTNIPRHGAQLRSTVDAGGFVTLSLDTVEVRAPQDDEVLVRLDAAPINPSDLMLMFPSADMTAAKFSGSGSSSTVTAPVAPGAMPGLAGRLGQPVACGYQGAGVVIAAGSSASAKALVGKTVAVFGTGTFAQYGCFYASYCLELPAGVSVADGASALLNPLTALSQIGTMRREGRKALVHTAAASNVGLMLNRLCIADGIALVNIVRSPAQRELLLAEGAKYVCDSSSASFIDDLTAALEATGATIAFDAIGGGKLIGQILSCMETALLRQSPDSGVGGSGIRLSESGIHKQVYIYGLLDTGPTVIDRNFGADWSVGGWSFMPSYMMTIEPEEVAKMRQRVVAEITTTFASTYGHQITLAEALSPEAVIAYAKQHTGAKYLVTPNA